MEIKRIITIFVVYLLLVPPSPALTQSLPDEALWRVIADKIVERLKYHQVALEDYVIQLPANPLFANWDDRDYQAVPIPNCEWSPT